MVIREKNKVTGQRILGFLTTPFRNTVRFLKNAAQNRSFPSEKNHADQLQNKLVNSVSL